MAAVVPKTETTGSVIAVTFLPAPLHTPGNGVRACVCHVGGCAERGVMSLYKVYFSLVRRKERKKQKLVASKMILFGPS